MTPNDDFDPRHRLSPDEERDWKRTKAEPNTREDWEELNMLITSYRRNRIARHLKRAGASTEGQ